MPEVSTVTPQAQAGQQGPACIRWLERSAQAHATAVTQRTGHDFPPWVVVQSDEEVEGDTATTTHVAMVVTRMARLGAARGWRCVPLAMADAVTVTQALVLEQALVTLRMDALSGASHVDVPQTGRATPLGAALQQWLDAVRRALGAPPAATRSAARRPRRGDQPQPRQSACGWPALYTAGRPHDGCRCWACLVLGERQQALPGERSSPPVHVRRHTSLL